LLAIAAVHYQLEAIHPFIDGSEDASLNASSRLVRMQQVFQDRRWHKCRKTPTLIGSP
jgi:Fic/DOC family